MRKSGSTLLLLLALVLASCSRAADRRPGRQASSETPSDSTPGRAVRATGSGVPGGSPGATTPPPAGSGTSPASPGTPSGHVGDGSPPPLQEAYLAGGCFWCVEAVFEELKGVKSAVSGYTGGAAPRPTYQQVCNGTTGHAEAVRVTFDPAVISYRQLLDVFFVVHDPTTLDRQGADVGTQYRSAIFYTSEGQKRDAEQAKRDVEASGEWGAPLVTQIVPLTEFYAAEEYHQDYYTANPQQPYCRAVISPKMQKFHKRFANLLKNP